MHGGGWNGDDRQRGVLSHAPQPSQSRLDAAPAREKWIGEAGGISLRSSWLQRSAHGNPGGDWARAAEEAAGVSACAPTECESLSLPDTKADRTVFVVRLCDSRGRLRPIRGLRKPSGGDGKFPATAGDPPLRL